MRHLLNAAVLSAVVGLVGRTAVGGSAGQQKPPGTGALPSTAGPAATRFVPADSGGRLAVSVFLDVGTLTEPTVAALAAIAHAALN